MWRLSLGEFWRVCVGLGGWSTFHKTKEPVGSWAKNNTTPVTRCHFLHNGAVDPVCAYRVCVCVSTYSFCADLQVCTEKMAMSLKAAILLLFFFFWSIFSKGIFKFISGQNWKCFKERESLTLKQKVLCFQAHLSPDFLFWLFSFIDIGFLFNITGLGGTFFQVSESCEGFSKRNFLTSKWDHITLHENKIEIIVSTCDYVPIVRWLFFILDSSGSASHTIYHPKNSRKPHI